MENFTPLSAAIGGTLIGLSAVLLMAFNGRIAGISGVFSGAVFAGPGERAWRWMFVLGLVAAPLFYSVLSGTRPAFDMQAGWPMIIAGGFLVGFGTRLGSGCTSGHGICGLSRFSPRAMLAVGVFMVAGMVTVAIIRMLVGG